MITQDNQITEEILNCEDSGVDGSSATTYTCEVFRFNKEKMVKHDNADSLSIYNVPDSSYNIVIKTSDWENYDGLVAWIEPDSLVPTNLSEFMFLASDAKFTRDSIRGIGTYARVRAKKLRGYQSYGILVPLNPESGLKEGDDCWEYLKLGHYEPVQGKASFGGIKGLISGEIAVAPKVIAPVYGVEKFMKIGKHVLQEGELVNWTLKLNGESYRTVYHDGEFYCGSHYTWKKEYSTPPIINKDSLIRQYGEEKAKEVCEKLENKFANFKSSQSKWWKVFRENEWLEKFCRDNPDTIVYGELIGGLAKFKYGLKPEEISVRVFDLMKDGQWLTYNKARDIGKDLKWVRTLKENAPFSFAETIDFIENMPSYDNSPMFEEGVVLIPKEERVHPKHGRVKLKLINPKYLEKS